MLKRGMIEFHSGQFLLVDAHPEQDRGRFLGVEAEAETEVVRHVGNQHYIDLPGTVRRIGLQGIADLGKCIHTIKHIHSPLYLPAGHPLLLQQS